QRLSAAGATTGSSEHETGAAHGLDQRRVAELRPQIRDIAIDDVQARRGSPAPDALQRELARDDPTAIAEQQLEQIRLPGAQPKVAAGARGASRACVKN